jgi:DNA-binding transcriptional MocR family regulator
MSAEGRGENSAGLGILAARTQRFSNVLPRNEQSLTLAARIKKQEDPTAQAYREVRRMIVEVSVLRRQRLSHRNLSRDIGIGRRPVRDALLQLEAEGLIEHRPSSGIYAPGDPPVNWSASTSCGSSTSPMPLKKPRISLRPGRERMLEHVSWAQLEIPEHYAAMRETAPDTGKKPERN